MGISADTGSMDTFISSESRARNEAIRENHEPMGYSAEGM